MKKSDESSRFPSSKASGKWTADLKTKPAVVPASLQFGLEFGQREILHMVIR
jgi:hypothetical protein